jgi:hypothetical protein
LKHSLNAMSTVIKIVCYTLLTTACIIAASVGVVAVQKYQSDVEKFDTIQSYNLNATCWLTSTTFSSQNGDCRIEEFQVSLMVGATSGWMPGFTAFSNFFSDSCGGVVYYTNVSGLDPNMTQLPCFYRSLNDTTVRLVPASMFAADAAYLYAGAILVVLGVLPPAIVIVGCWFRLARWVQRRLRLRWFRQHVQDPSALQLQRAAAHAPDVAMTSEVRAEPGTDWAGRLVRINEFAGASAMRFENTALVQMEECPLCFKAFGDACVWWTCGHCVCGECNPKVLRAEKQWGHSQSPRCPLCRVRSDVGDIVKVLLSGSSEPHTEVTVEGDE